MTPNLISASAALRLLVLIGLCSQSMGGPTDVRDAVQAAVQRSIFQASPTVASRGFQVEADPRALELAAQLAKLVAARMTNATNPAAGPTISAQSRALARLVAEGGTNVQVILRSGVNTPLAIRGGILGRAGASLAAVAAGDRTQATALAFLTKQRDLLLLEDPERELVLDRVLTDADGALHLRYSQQYLGIPVWPCKLSVHLDAAGRVYQFDGAYVPTPGQVGVAPRVSGPEAIAAARQATSPPDATPIDDPTLVIDGRLNGTAALAWKVEVAADLTHDWLVLVDAHSGTILYKLDQCAADNVPGTGKDLLGISRPLNVWHQGNQYYLIDTSKPMFNPATQNGAIVVHDARGGTENQIFVNGQLTNVYSVTSALPTAWSIPDTVSAAFNFSETYDYYRERHGRNSYDDAGADLEAIVRIGQLQNAYWNGGIRTMIFGNADRYAASLDVIAHELTHAVTQSSAQLVYDGQSGALNEAMSDVFGEMTEARTAQQPDWIIGTALNQPLRNMRDPSSLFIGGTARRFPATMASFIAPEDPFLANFVDNDHGGVHLNSGIINHAYYLLAAGLPNPLGLHDAERIFYRDLTVHLHPQSQFVDARLGGISSAEEIFGAGSPQAVATAAAFDAVGILGSPTTPDPGRIPTVQGVDSVLFLYRDLFAPSDSIWRRETALGDVVGGNLLARNVDRARLSVAGDGTYALYVTTDNDVGFLATDGSLNQALGHPGTVHSVAISPDSRYVVFVLRDAFGNPENKLHLGILGGSSFVVDLHAPLLDGGTVDNIVYADSLTFTADSTALVFDALSQFAAPDQTAESAWSIYRLDLATQTVNMIVPPISGIDTGNPSMSRTSNRYLTCDAVGQTSGAAVVLNLDLHLGTAVAVSATLNDMGFPGFTGDDSSIVYTGSDAGALTGQSIWKQPLGPDHLSPSGSAAVWLSDGWRGVAYRRGVFVDTNALPTVSIVSPRDGAVIKSGTPVVIQAAAADSDGTVAKVEIYAGATKIGEAAGNPPTLTVVNPAPGTYRLTARAIDNLGGTTDSVPINVTIGDSTPLKIASISRSLNGSIGLSLSGPVGATNVIQVSNDLAHWSTATTFVNTTGTFQFNDSTPGDAARFYRVKQQ